MLRFYNAHYEGEQHTMHRLRQASCMHSFLVSGAAISHVAHVSVSVCVCTGNMGLLKFDSKLPDEKVILLSDIL